MPDYRVVVTNNTISHEFLLDGGPLDDPRSIQEPIYALGALASNWARLEQQIDMILIQVNKAQHSNEARDLYDPDHPASFSRKTKLLKKYFNQHPALSPHKEDMRGLIPKLKALSKYRNSCIHSILEAYDPATDSIRLNSVRFDGNDQFTATQFWVKIEGVKRATEMVNNANRYLTIFSRALFNRDALEQLGKS